MADVRAKPKVDGRKARGLLRRQAILDATLAIVESRGVAGVNHRAVAETAGVQPSLVAYYFASLDDLLVATLKSAADSYERDYDALLEAGKTPIAAIAEITATSAKSQRARALAEWELILLAVKRPALRPMALRWRALVATAARAYTDDPVVVDAFVACADGLCVEGLLRPASRPLDATSIERCLFAVLGTDSASRPRRRPARKDG